MKEPNGVPTSSVKHEPGLTPTEILLTNERDFHQGRWNRKAKETLRGWFRKRNQLMK